MNKKSIDKNKSKYILVKWPESQLIMDETWFDNECHLASMNTDKNIGNSAYFIPYSRIKFLHKELKIINSKT